MLTATLYLAIGALLGIGALYLVSWVLARADEADLRRAVGEDYD